MIKRENPYSRLKRIAMEYANKVNYPRKRTMWHYPKKKLKEAWTLSDLWERVAAAEQLDYDVLLIANEDGLVVQYVKKKPTVPWEIRS